MQPSGANNGHKQDGSLLDQYRSALISGDAQSASRTVTQSLDTGMSPGQIYSEIVMPAQIEVGKLWSDCKVGICEEHRATHITLTEMARLRLLIKPLSHLGVRAVVLSVDGDDHYIGARAVADFLLIDGWDVQFLGAKTPVGDLIKFLEKNQFDLIGLSATGATSLSELRTAISSIRKMNNPPKIMAGGDTVYSNIEQVKSWGVDAIAFNAEEAVRVARKICGISEQDTTLARYLFGLGDRITEIRKSRKFSQARLAELSGLDRAYISSVENGKQNVTIGAIVKLASALGVSLEDLLNSRP